MRPLFYCMQCALGGNALWKRKGVNIKYYKNDYIRINQPNAVNIEYYYTLSFTFKCGHPGRHRVAYNYPFTYTDLLIYLKHLKQHPIRSLNCRVSNLCSTIGGRYCPLLSITDFSSSSEELKQRPVIVFTGRVHPGETPGSWIMMGLIDALLESSEAGLELRRRYIFKIVPMLNPDGVAIGNSR